MERDLATEQRSARGEKPYTNFGDSGFHRSNDSRRSTPLQGHQLSEAFNCGDGGFFAPL